MKNKKVLFFLLIITIVILSIQCMLPGSDDNNAPANDKNSSTSAVSSNASSNSSGSQSSSSSSITFQNWQIINKDIMSFAQGCDVFKSGNFAYVADDISGLKIINVSDPLNMIFVSSINTPGNAKAVYVSGNYAYVADGAEGLQIIDVSDPSTASIVKSVSLAVPESEKNSKSVNIASGYAYDVFVENNYLYLAAGNEGLKIIDISNPLSAAIVNTVYAYNNTTSVYVSGDYAYITDEKNGIYLVKITNPYTAYVYHKITHYSDSINKIFVSNGYMFIAENNGLSITYGITPYPEFYRITTSGIATDVSVSGNYAYVSNENGYINIIDISNPASLSIVNTILAGSSNMGLCLSGNYLYTTAYSNLKIIDINNPLTASAVNSISFGSSVDSMYAAGNYIYIWNRTYLEILDASSASSPYAVNKVTIPGSPGSANVKYIDNNTAFVSDSNCFFHIIDITNPLNAAIIKSVKVSSYPAMGIHVSGNYAYLACQNDGLFVVDITDPASAYIKFSFDDMNCATDVYVSGKYAYVTDSLEGLRIIEILFDAPCNIVNTIITGTGMTINGLFGKGNYIYMAAHRGSSDTGYFYIIDISTPLSETIAKQIFFTKNNVRDVWVSGNYALLANSGNGLQAIDISDPLNAYIYRTVDTPGNAVKVCASGGYIYVADGFGGLIIIR